MTDISKKILEEYQVRKTKKQKLEFIELLRGYFPNLTVEKGGIGGNRNIVIGDVNSAKAVLTAHYDTCAVMPVPNFIMPKSVLISILYGLVLAVPIIALTFLITFLTAFVTENAEAGATVGLIAYFVFFALLFVGPSNKHTVNDNTSGVITLIELLSTMPEEEQKNLAFVFFDNEEVGLLGSAFFASKHRNVMKEKLLINFDCVSDGDHIMLIANKKAEQKYKETLSTAFKGASDKSGKTVLVEGTRGIYYPSDQANFRCNIGVAAFKKGKLGLYLDRIHTPKDTVMDERNIDLIVKGITAFLRGIQ